jgi:Fe-S oxidoreductase
LSAEELIVACPGCKTTLDGLVGGIKVRTAWELLADDWQPRGVHDALELAVHDPCAARHDDISQRAVRIILERIGVDVVDGPPTGRETRCCGLGGQIKAVNPDLTATIARRRASEFQTPVATYCSRCRASLHRGGASTVHVAELMVGGDLREALAKTPLGTLRRYTNRLLAKRAFRRLRDVGMGG